MERRFQLRLADHWLELPEGATIIGRDSAATIVLDDDLVSRRHAVIEIKAERATLQDLDSRNGTFLNSVRVEGRVELTSGDRIGIGNHVLEIRLHGETQGAHRPTLNGQRLPTMAQVPASVVETGEMDVLTKYVQLERWREVENLLKGRVSALMEKPGRISVDDPKAISVLGAMVALAEQSLSPVWLDRLFRLCLSQGWKVPSDILDRIYRVLRASGDTGGDALAQYVTHWQTDSFQAKLTASEKDRIRMLGDLVRMYRRHQ